MTSQFGRMSITVIMTNSHRKRLYSTQTYLDNNQVIVFWLGESPSQLLMDSFMALQPGDKIIVAYEYKKSGEYIHKVIKSIMKDSSPKTSDFFRSTAYFDISFDDNHLKND